MKTKKNIATIIIFLVSTFCIFYFGEKQIKTNYNKLDLNGYNKLMIVAHPDDEMLWGGSRLIQDNYLVVCITCGGNQERVKEIETVMEKTNDKLVILNYPDKTNGERDNWDNHRDNIKEDLINIFSLKEWELIVTHNPEGEYGHIHHVMTNKLVTDNADKSKLYYFGKYYSKKELIEVEKLPKPLDKDVLDKKVEILQIYVTQDFINDMFNHMFQYEDWKSYEQWQELKDENYSEE